MSRKYHRYVGGKVGYGEPVQRIFDLPSKPAAVDKGQPVHQEREYRTPQCRKCDQPLAFVKKPGKGGILKLFPVNPDGSDHWDLCKTIQRKATGMIRADGSIDFSKTDRAHPPAWTKSRNVTHVYCGTVPPWDESLGAFRYFTAEEKAAGVVCRKI